MKKNERPVGLMTLAQIVCIAVICGVLLLVSYIPNIHIHQWLMLDPLTLLPEFLRDLALMVCIVYVAVETLRICTRIKKATTFSAVNANALGRIASALLICCGITLCFGDPFIARLYLNGLPAIHPAVEHLLLPFTLLTVAAMVRAVQLLMRRALTMQEESELTI